MNLEYTILYLVWNITVFSLFFIPTNKYREASIAFLFQQFVTWFLGILVVEWNWINYPVRLLANVNETSFTFEFFVYPVIGIFFVLYFPIYRSLFNRFLYYFSYTTGITIPEILFEKYTDTIEFVHWTWYYTWISIFLSLVLLRVFYKWYFNERTGSRNSLFSKVD
ncbi:CBO0543 family protein [Halalkalibacter kiskunsagensis]|uniref:CBO0543 family protein n=1 Tax=Halalkalibacter kiskunsagensis TaxID=1548599 RepID=A0ABV6KHF1_9BACI